MDPVAQVYLVLPIAPLDRTLGAMRSTGARIPGASAPSLRTRLMPSQTTHSPGRGEKAVQAPGHCRPDAVLRYLTIAVALVAGAWLLFFAAVTLVIPHPIEYREGAAQVVTQLLLAGRNPFTPENQPLGMTNYGFMFSLVAWPLAALFGNTLLVHRAITMLFLVLGAYVIARTAVASNRQVALGLVGAELVTAALAARGGLGGYPGAMGTYLFLVAVTAPHLRNFDRQGLVLSGVASLLALYTKAYFILGAGIVAAYTFLFISKKAGVIYALCVGAAVALSALLVRTVLPLYFYDTVFSNLAHTVERDPAHLARQLRQLATELLPLIVAGLVMILADLSAWHRRVGGANQILIWRDLLVPPRPVFAARMDYFAWASLCALLAFVLILGPHPENYMNYCYQLLVPLFVLWLLANMRPLRTLTRLVTPLILANLILFCLTRLPPDQLQQSTESARAWDVLQSYADRCNRPWNSPTIVPELIRRGLWPIDSGHTEYFFGAQPYPGMAWFGASHELVADLGTTYLNTLRASVVHQDFDCIVLARHSAWPRNLPLERGGYQLADSVVIAMPQTDQTWQMDIWVPAVK
jgi:hypothetical protein